MIEIALIAQSSGPGGAAGCFTGMVPLILIFLIFWFIVIRPEQKKQQEHQDFLESIKVGDKVVTAGGLFGEVTAVDDDTVKMKINRNNRIRVLRQQIKGPQSQFLGSDDDEEEDETDEDAEIKEKE